MIIRLLAILLLVLLNALFVGAEFSLVRARRPRLEAMARGGDRLAKLALRALASLPRMLSTCQIGITLSSLGLGWLVAEWVDDMPIAAGRPVNLTIAIVVALITIAYLHIVFGELVPKAAALSRPESVARFLAPPLLGVAWLMTPFTVMLNRSSQLFARRSRAGTPGTEEHAHSPDELRLLVEQSEARGAIQKQDAALLEGVFEFSEKNAREVMTPRTEIVALSVDASLDDVLTVVAANGLSRYPVCEGSIDNIVGLVLAKDLIPVIRGQVTEFSLRTLMRDVHVIPGTREVEEVLGDFKRLKEHMAIVLDEYGGTAGVVTMEDLLEEIVGEILDEHDERVEVPLPRAGELLVLGETNIGEMNERLGISVPTDDYTTIGGFVFGTLGRLPQVGDNLTTGGATFTVRSMTGRRVERLAVRVASLGGQMPAGRE